MEPLSSKSDIKDVYRGLTGSLNVQEETELVSFPKYAPFEVLGVYRSG